MTYRPRKKIIALVIVGFSLIVFAAPYLAAARCSSESFSTESNIRLSVGIPFVTTMKRSADGSQCYYLTGGLTKYISGLYTFAVSIAGFIAMVMLIVAGAQYVTAAGRADKINTAKQRIEDALIGLLLLLFAVTMLNFINPALTTLTGIGVAEVDAQEARIQSRITALEQERESALRAIDANAELEEEERREEKRRVFREYSAQIVELKNQIRDLRR